MFYSWLLVDFGRACAPVRCAHPSFWAHCHPNGGLRPPPSIAASLLLIQPPKIYKIHKVLTYEEYRAVSGVFQNIHPPPPPTPLSTQRVCPPPTPKAGGYTLAWQWGRGVNILEDARHWIGLLQYNLSTIKSFELGPPTSRAFFFPLNHSSYSCYSSRTILFLFFFSYIWICLLYYRHAY